MRDEDRGGLRAYRFDTMPADHVDVLVSTRAGGVSVGRHASLNLGLHVGDEDHLVMENRRRLFAAYRLPLKRSVWCSQVHKATVAVVDEDTVRDGPRGAESLETALAGTDAVVTASPGIVLAVMLADCVPVALYDPDRHVLGLAHAGWGGTVARIASATVRTMQETFGSDPTRLVAGIGPSISRAHYEVGEDVAAQARAAYGDDAGHVVRPAESAGKSRFDLWRANALDLERAGVRPDAIEISGLSTIDRLDEFYSHRAEQATGRFATLAALR